MAVVKCANCRTYIDRDKAIRFGLSSFCDQDCVQQKTKNVSKPAKPIKAKKKKTQIANVDNEIIFAKDRYRCRLCQKQSYNLAVHHIIYRGTVSNKNYQEEFWNRISLCNEPCHLSIVHGNKKEWQPLLLGLTWFRETQNKYLTVKQLKDIINANTTTNG